MSCPLICVLSKFTFRNLASSKTWQASSQPAKPTFEIMRCVESRKGSKWGSWTEAVDQNGRPWRSTSTVHEPRRSTVVVRGSNPGLALRWSGLTFLKIVWITGKWAKLTAKRLFLCCEAVKTKYRLFFCVCMQKNMGKYWGKWELMSGEIMWRNY